ncbi:MAG: ATP-binding protein, partial [Longimicrobiales bacterium]
LILSIVGISTLLVVPAIYSVTQLDQLNDIASVQRTRHGEAYLAMGGLQARLAELNRLQRTYIIAPDAEVHEDMRSALDSARARLNELGTAGYGETARNVANLVDSLNLATSRIEQLVAEGRKQEASDYFLTQVRPLFINAEMELRRVYAYVDRTSRRELETAGIISSAAIATTLAALLICATVAFGLGAWTTRALTTPIMRLRDSMALVADGELRVPETLPYDRQDEIGSVSRSFRAMTHRLVDLDRLKAEFMSISTHELKTPINVISGYAELMQERVYGDLSEKQEEALFSIREQTRVLTQLVNQLLDVSRLEAGGMRLHFHDVVVVDLLRRVERSFDALATKKNIAFQVTIDSSVPATIAGDSDRLADQVLGNLISNALKFTPEGGRIEVRSWLHDDGLVIEVEDSGPGIPADQLPYIFDKFFQVGEQARSKGAGLGLTIAHEVVTSHGGSITAASEPGQGTTFRIVLPTDGITEVDHELVQPARQGAHQA